MNKQTLRLTLLAGTSIWLAACTGGPAVSVKTDYNHKVSFTGYKTYALDLSEAPELRPTGRAALTESLKSSLAARGITETSRGQADLVVVLGDPSTTIGDVRRVETVFKNGVGYDPQKLVESVKGQVGIW